MPEGLTQTKTPNSKKPAGFKSECRPVSFRNRGRLQIGTGAGFTSEYPAGINRNPQITWRAVVLQAGAALKGRRFSRQALESHDKIYRAYAEAKRRLRKGLLPAKRKPAAGRIAALRDSNRGLRAENDALIEKFVKWQVNAQKHDVRPEQLEEALPAAHLPEGFREAQIER